MASAIHTLHPDSHVAGLADECPACDENADHPWDKLDDHNLHQLISMIVLDKTPRSTNESVALYTVKKAWVVLGRLGYLADYHGLGRT